jgi:hypothetical protein
MITIGQDVLDGINQAVDVNDGTRILDFDLNVTQPSPAILIN